MVSTICFSTANRIDYALEGIIVSCGASVKWLRDQLGLLSASRDSEAMARAVPDNGGVYFIPAFAGLGAPSWKMEARAAITGLSFASTRKHIVRAALEAIAYQIKDVIVAMEQDAGSPLRELNLDGGITENAFVTDLIADLLGCPVQTIGLAEVSALGAAYLAGLEVGVYENPEALKELNTSRIVHLPGPGRPAALEWHSAWKKAINRIV
jgi:glycerol kinase